MRFWRKIAFAFCLGFGTSLSEIIVDETFEVCSITRGPLIGEDPRQELTCALEWVQGGLTDTGGGDQEELVLRQLSISGRPVSQYIAVIARREATAEISTSGFRDVRLSAEVVAEGLENTDFCNIYYSIENFGVFTRLDDVRTATQGGNDCEGQFNKGSVDAVYNCQTTYSFSRLFPELDQRDKVFIRIQIEANGFRRDVCFFDNIKVEGVRITPQPTPEPTVEPTRLPTGMPTDFPSPMPTVSPVPTERPTSSPSGSPTAYPTAFPTTSPTTAPTPPPQPPTTPNPTSSPVPTFNPTREPSLFPTQAPTVEQLFSEQNVTLLAAIIAGGKRDRAIGLFVWLYRRNSQQGPDESAGKELLKRKQDMTAANPMYSVERKEATPTEMLEEFLKLPDRERSRRTLKEGEAQEWLHRASESLSQTNSEERQSMQLKMKMKYSFHAENDDELTARAGDVLICLDQKEAWFVAQNPETGETGLVPVAYVVQFDDE